MVLAVFWQEFSPGDHPPQTVSAEQLIHDTKNGVKRKYHRGFGSWGRLRGFGLSEPPIPNPLGWEREVTYHLTGRDAKCIHGGVMENYSEVYPLRVTTAMYRAIKKAAEAEHLSIAQYLRKLIREANPRTFPPDREKR